LKTLEQGQKRWHHSNAARRPRRELVERGEAGEEGGGVAVWTCMGQAGGKEAGLLYVWKRELVPFE